jgi:small subunit ribosomal protein S20
MANDKKTAGKSGPKKLLTAQKRILQSEEARKRNKSRCAQVNTAIRTLKANLGKADATLVAEQLNRVYSLMDKGVKTGLFKQNKSARVKSKLASAVFGKA